MFYVSPTKCIWTDNTLEDYVTAPLRKQSKEGIFSMPLEKGLQGPGGPIFIGRILRQKPQGKQFLIFCLLVSLMNLQRPFPLNKEIILQGLLVQYCCTNKRDKENNI